MTTALWIIAACAVISLLSGLAFLAMVSYAIWNERLRK